MQVSLPDRNPGFFPNLRDLNMTITEPAGSLPRIRRCDGTSIEPIRALGLGSGGSTEMRISSSSLPVFPS